ncbi:hypothetical protein PENSPDRAFT_671548 [Peniophora sp. CONT]|nr:hypothetical protein PENSPDRAFT_671548 [Peniophora sp. CONT]
MADATSAPGEPLPDDLSSMTETDSSSDEPSAPKKSSGRSKDDADAVQNEVSAPKKTDKKGKGRAIEEEEDEVPVPKKVDKKCREFAENEQGKGKAVEGELSAPKKVDQKGKGKAVAEPSALKKVDQKGKGKGAGKPSVPLSSEQPVEDMPMDVDDVHPPQPEDMEVDEEGLAPEIERGDRAVQQQQSSKDGSPYASGHVEPQVSVKNTPSGSPLGGRQPAWGVHDRTHCSSPPLLVTAQRASWWEEARHGRERGGSREVIDARALRKSRGARVNQTLGQVTLLSDLAS